jgi:hypothetical protein
MRTAMIVGNRRTGAFLLVLAMALLLGFITVIWFNRKKTPTPVREPPMHTACSRRLSCTRAFGCTTLDLEEVFLLVQQGF